MTPQEATEQLLKAAKKSNTDRKVVQYKDECTNNANNAAILETARAALDAGADSTAKENDKLGPTALHLVVAANHIDFARLLITKGADINAQDAMQRTPLDVAIDNGCLGLAHLLIEKGAAVNGKRNGATILHEIIRAGYTDLAPLLVEKGADINAEDDDQQTPLHLAVKYRRTELVQFLLDKHAHISAVACTQPDVIRSLKNIVERNRPDSEAMGVHARA